MRNRAERVLSGWRAGRMVSGGGMLARDGLAYAVYQRADARSARCGRIPAYVAIRLKLDLCLTAVNRDPDRLAARETSLRRPVFPVPVPAGAIAASRRNTSLLAQLVAARPANGTRIKAAAARFLADYHLVASPGRLRTDQTRTRADAEARLRTIEAALGGINSALAEMLIIDRLTRDALWHVTGIGLPDALECLTKLAAVYGLAPTEAGKAQEAGSAFASA